LNDTLTVSADPFAASLAGRKLGRYEVLARLASGGMAAVYVARAIGVAGFERLVAIKVLHPHLAHEEEFISMFLDEARLAARIRHPNVVPTLDISDTPDAGFYLVMDYVEGDHFGALLQKAWKSGRRLPFPIALRIVIDALEGLSAAHNLTDETGRPLQLVHRDISPHNVMVSSDGVARITDFGVAKAEVRLSTTREGQFKGKLAYMAPEHASLGEADQRSDLFSMGIILWESLAGRRLFRAENHAATLNKICLEPIPTLSSVDPVLAGFDAFLARALARDPAERFQSAEEFAEAIEAKADLLGGVAKPREVAQMVREYAAEKLARDTELIRSAVQQLSQQAVNSESAPIPLIEQPVVEVRLSQPTPTTPATPTRGSEISYREFDASYREHTDYGDHGRRWSWIMVVVAAAALAGAVAALWTRTPQRLPSLEAAPASAHPKPADTYPTEPRSADLFKTEPSRFDTPPSATGQRPPNGADITDEALGADVQDVPSRPFAEEVPNRARNEARERRNRTARPDDAKLRGTSAANTSETSEILPNPYH